MIRLREDREELSLALAAILHDVGKIRQRDVITENHASLGHKFMLELYNIQEDVRKLSSELVRFHHTDPQKAILNDREKELLKILQLSDWNSASHDRDDRDPAEFRDDPRMHNIFQYVNTDPERDYGGKPNGQSMFPLITMESLISSHFSTRSGNISPADLSYRKLYSDLLQESAAVKFSDPFSFLSTLDSILLNYTSFVPSAFYYSQPNISLYDHLRLTASMAIVRYRRNKQGKDDNQAILVMGDVSGIQDYIFSHMVSEGVDDKATKRLRGRSFMVRLMTDSVVSYIMDTFKLYRFNVIWEKSDGFLIMMEYNDENLKRLESVRTEIELGFERLNRGPRMFIAWDEVSLDDLGDRKNNPFSDIIAGLASSLNSRKRKLLSNSMMDHWDEISGLDSEPKRICRFCGRGEVKQQDRCSGCLSEESLGDQLVKRDTLSRYAGNEGEISFHYGSYATSYSLQEDPNALEVISINRFDKKHSYRSERTILQGNYSPRTRDGSVESINTILCGNRENIKRCLYLGIAKIDVDNMGLLMTQGIRPLTMSRYASISGLMSAFFSVIANSIAAEYGVYLIYAGGDDISAMGPATDMMEFTYSLRKAFGNWVRNDQITLSTGLEVVDSNYPVRKGIDLAEDALERAKSNPGKNSLHVFGLTIPWGAMGDLENVSNRIEQLIISKDQSVSVLGRSFPSVLLDLDSENPYIDSDVRGRRIRIPDSYLTYYINRNARRISDAERDRLVSEISDSRVFRYIRFVAYSLIIKLRRYEYVSKQTE